MEQNLIQNNVIIPEVEVITSRPQSPFIEANTKAVNLAHLKNDCIIPVFSKDNETTISHHEFIGATQQAVQSIFSGQRILPPEIRASHIVKGRVPSAIGKSVKDLTEEDKTIYYERLAFKIDIPNITAKVGDNELQLSIGGVRAYNHENLYSKKTMERFKVFIGFKNMVCTNLCVSSDGSVEEIRASNVSELQNKIMDLIGNYEMQAHLKALESFPEYGLSEEQFAQFLGRCRMYQYLPREKKRDIPPLELNDGQIGQIAKGYYMDENFGATGNSISLWQLYNLLTGTNKSSYIDTFLHRSVNAHELTQELLNSIKYERPIWYLN
ncbi:DUF3871 family protein [Aestuariivivens sediminis]|uniref:DUF3871 family protein n=1 Tax=Aestuariivivens sediminis TaxID=2913557 RepID=UPI001F5908C0|nr:DUF3871 family protein [Aestuariivivens sediminis]